MKKNVLLSAIAGALILSSAGQVAVAASVKSYTPTYQNLTVINNLGSNIIGDAGVLVTSGNLGTQPMGTGITLMSGPNTAQGGIISYEIRVSTGNSSATCTAANYTTKGLSFGLDTSGNITLNSLVANIPLVSIYTNTPCPFMKSINVSLTGSATSSEGYTVTFTPGN